MALSALRTVLLDLDGTLIDHFQTIYRCYAESLHQLGLEPVSYEKVKATVGGGIRVTFSRLVPEEHVEPGVKLWMECFERHWAEGIELLP
ncbi:MAG: HAD family hydrolase, partial [Opitutales bacterium]